MKYLIVQDWDSTHGNHAGMLHMCRLLEKHYPKDYKVIVKSSPLNFPLIEKKQSIVGKIITKAITKKIYEKKIYPLEYFQLCFPLYHELKDGDEVFLLEYLLSMQSQYELAIYLRKNFPHVKLYALSHQTVNYFKHCVKGKEIIKWSVPVNKMLTLGSSLSEYFEEVGIPREKINTGFHYVDNDYYHKSCDIGLRSERLLTVIAMGNQQRDYSLLAKVVSDTPNIHWIICRGNNKDVDDLFPQSENVDLKGFLSEDELKHQMDIADVSINIMSDTVGSNVITTSMAMGLAMIVSDVGSIRDYCNDSNALFCENNYQSFVKALNALNNDRAKVLRMKKSSLELSQKLHIENVNMWFNSL